MVENIKNYKTVEKV